MYFGSNRRFSLLHSFLSKESNGETLSEYHEYVGAMGADIQDIWQTISHYVGIHHKVDPSNIHVRINPESLSPIAFVQRQRRELVIELSASFVMMIDQLTSFWAKEAFDHFDTFGLERAITERSDFAYDFSYLFSQGTKSYVNNKPVSQLTQIIAYSADPEFSRTLELLANLTISWVILHEFYHAELAHLDGDLAVIDECAWQWDSQNLGFELEADAFATVTLMAIAHRADFADTYLSRRPQQLRSCWFQYLQFCCLQSSSMMHKLYLVPRSEELSPVDLNRINSLRLHNIFRSSVRILPNIEAIQRGMGLYKGRELPIEISEEDLLTQVAKNLNNIDWLCRSLAVGPICGTAEVEIVHKPSRLVPFEITIIDQIGIECFDDIVENVRVLFGFGSRRNKRRVSRIEKLGEDWATLIYRSGERLMKRTNWSVPDSMNFLDGIFYIYSDFHETIANEIEQRAFGNDNEDAVFGEETIGETLLKIPEFALMAQDKDRDPVLTRDGKEISIRGDGGARFFIP